MATALNPQMAGEQGIPLEEAYGLTKEALQQARPDAALELDAALEPLLEEMSTLTDQQLQRILQVLQQMYSADAEGYPALLQQLQAQGVLDPGDLPDEYNPEFIAAAIALVLETLRDRQRPESGDMMEPQGFARGGIAAAARRVARAGRRGDTMLAHVTPREAQMLKQRGGAGSINPRTGLPEFFLKKLFKSVGNALKEIFQNPIGRVLGTVGLTALLGPVAGAFAAPAAAGLGTALAGGSVKDVFRTAAFSLFSGPGGPLNQFLSPMTDALGLGAFSPALAQGVRSGITATAAGLLTGRSLQEAVREGMMLGAIQGASEALLPTQPAQPTARPEAAPTTPVPGAATSAPPVPGAPAAGAGAAPAAGAAPVAGGAVPIGQAMQTMGSGLRQMAGGQFQQGLGTLGQGARDLFMPQAPDQAAIVRRASELSKQLTAEGAPVTEAWRMGMEAARKEMTPSMLRQYGPAIAGGLGVMGLAGGFRQKEPELTPLQRQMQEYNEAAYRRVKDSPRNYAPIAAGERFGLRYDEQGNIIGSSPYGSQYQPWWMENREPRGFSEGGAVTPPAFQTEVDGRKITTPVLFNPAQPVNRQQMMNAIRVPSRTLEDTAMGYPAQQASYWRERNQARLMGTPFTGGNPPPVPQYVNRLPREGEMPPPSEPVTFQPSPITRGPYASIMPVRVPESGHFQGPIRAQLPRRSTFTSTPNTNAPPGFTEIGPRLYPNPPEIAGPMPGPGILRANGGIASVARGGYPRKVGAIDGPGTETSDSIPAMLSDGEFVMTAKAVRGAGRGSRREGAKRMYALMHKLERNAAKG